MPEVMQVTDYYPFGLVMNQENYFADGVLSNKYLYNNKELQDDELAGNSLGWYDYGARFYDAELGMFHTVDPLAEAYSHRSPFTYAANNPIRFTDFLGMGPDDMVENDEEEKKKKTTIDPGHGDHHDSNSQIDPGAVNGDDLEKDLSFQLQMQ